MKTDLSQQQIGGWPTASLESLCSMITSGGTPRRLTPGYYTSAGGVPWVRTQELQDRLLHETEEHITERAIRESSAKILPKGTLLMAMYAAPTAGRMAILGREMACNQAACAFVFDPKVANTRYMFYQLLHARPDLHRLANGAAQQNLSARILRQLEVVVPPLAEQRRIAAVLGALDDLIEVNSGLMATIEDLLSARFAQFRFDALGDSRLGDLIQVNPQRPRPKGDAAYIEMSALSETQAGIDRVARRPAVGGARFINGDTLMARITPCLENGKIGYVDCLLDGEVGVGSTEFIVLRSDSPFPLPWSYLLARSPRFRDHVVRHMTGTSGRQRCPADAVSDYSIRAPDSADLSTFGELADPLFGALKELRLENQELRSTRDQLLPLLMAGRVRVVEGVAA